MKRHFPWRAFGLFLFVSSVVLATFLIWGDALDAWTKDVIGRSAGNRGQIAIVLFLILASDIFLPIPSSIASTLCGLLLGAFLGFLVSFAAMSVSAAAGWFLGRFASGWARRLIGEDDMASLQAFQRRFGPWSLLALRPVPILAEASTVFAGIGRSPWGATAFQLALGNAAVSMVYALVGAYCAETDNASCLAFFAAVAVSGVFVFVRFCTERKCSL